MRSSNSKRSVAVLVLIGSFVVLPLAAQTTAPPFFGPPGMHANTLSALVDNDGTPGPSAGDSPAFFEWLATDEEIGIANPWEDCAQTSMAFSLTPFMTAERQGTYTSFENFAMARGFNFDDFDNDGNPIGGSYWSEVGDFGTATLEKSDQSQDHYDLVHLASTNPGRQLDVVLPLVMHHGNGAEYVGVGNIASLGVIGTCGNSDANTDIMIPMGSRNGMPAIILDLEGDGSPSAGFLASPPLGSRQQPSPAIPTLGTWGFAILVVSLLAIGLMILRWSGATVSI